MAVTQINELAVTGTSAGSAWFAMDKEVSPGVYQTQKIAGENIGGNLFSQALTLTANREHDMNGFGLKFLKSNFEFRALDGLSSGRAVGIRNHTNTGWAFEVRNNLDIIANGGTNNDNITSIGYLSGKSGSANTFYGRSAGQSTSTGTDNTMIGYASGLSCSTGNQNVFIGHSAGVGNNGSNNIFIGLLAGAYNTGNSSTFIGWQSGGLGVASGSANSFYGMQSALYLGNGSENAAFGNASLLNIGNGSFNSALGVASGRNTSGNYNSFFGYYAAQAHTNGANNVFLGHNSGTYYGSGIDTMLDANNSVFLGAFARSNANNQTNEIVIGHNAIGEGSNKARIGNSSVTELHVGGNGAALALKSPNGTTWRISVDNTGTLVIV